MTERFRATPSQTVGPFFAVALPWAGGATLVDEATKGARIEVAGRVLDGEDAPVPDALVEIWQANAAGRYASPEDPRDELPIDAHFLGFGRCATRRDGTFHFTTIRPGTVPGPGGVPQAAHLAVGVFARGLLKRLVTRCYFPDDPAIAADPVLSLVPSERRSTLIASPRPGVVGGFSFDIVLRGRRETVFFDS